MNTAEFIALVAFKSKTDYATARSVVLATMDSIKDQVRSGGKVMLWGFGTFEVLRRKSRLGRNPINGRQVTIPEMVVPKFRSSTVWRESVSSSLSPRTKKP